MSTAIQNDDSAGASCSRHCSDELLPLVYQDLRRLASRKFRHEVPGQSLQATALVHEAYLRVAGIDNDQWDNLGHFFGAVAEAMRRLMIERWRRRSAKKRGGGWQRLSVDKLDEQHGRESNDRDVRDLEAIDKALYKLEQHDPVKAEVVKLRFFAGLTIPEVAEVLSVSSSTVDNYWAYARAWLRVELDQA